MATALGCAVLYRLLFYTLPVYINSIYCTKSVSAILPVSYLEAIIHSSETLLHSPDDMGSLGINSIDGDMYPYLSLTAGVEAWEKGRGRD